MLQVSQQTPGVLHFTALSQWPHGNLGPLGPGLGSMVSAKRRLHKYSRVVLSLVTGPLAFPRFSFMDVMNIVQCVTCVGFTNLILFSMTSVFIIPFQIKAMQSTSKVQQNFIVFGGSNKPEVQNVNKEFS